MWPFKKRRVLVLYVPDSQPNEARKYWRNMHVASYCMVAAAGLLVALMLLRLRKAAR